MKKNKWFLNGGRGSGQTYRRLFEYYENKVANLEKENAELKTKVTALENANKAMVKELDDMTSGGLSVLENVVRSKDQLAKAKDILRRLMENQSTPSSMYEEIDLVGWREVNKEAEQFLNEVEK